MNEAIRWMKHETSFVAQRTDGRSEGTIEPEAHQDDRRLVIILDDRSVHSTSTTWTLLLAFA
jgi:hypothetical protein